MCIVFSICWACMLIFEGHCIEYVCWWEFVCKLSETLHALYSSYCIFWERDEWHSLRSSGSCPFHHYFHCWCDFTPCLIWVDHYSSLCYLFHHHPRFRFWFIIFTSRRILFLQQPISGLILYSHHHYTYHYQFILLHLSPHRHHIHVRHP